MVVGGQVTSPGNEPCLPVGCSSAVETMAVDDHRLSLPAFTANSPMFIGIWHFDSHTIQISEWLPFAFCFCGYATPFLASFQILSVFGFDTGCRHCSEHESLLSRLDLCVSWSPVSPVFFVRIMVFPMSWILVWSLGFVLGPTKLILLVAMWIFSL